MSKIEEFKTSLNPCARSGQGVHKFVFYASCKAIDEFQLTDEEAEPIIRAAMTRNPNPASEISDALRSARREERVPAQLWEPRNEEKIKEIVRKSYELNLTTPVFPTAHPEIMLDRLFPGNPLLCLGKTNYLFDTKRRNEWRGLEKFQSLIVPSPMSALKGKTKFGNLSSHSLENTGPRQYLVVEFDQGSMEDQYKLLFYLAKEAPLVLVCSSGGKSLHGWFNVKNAEPIPTLLFMQNAVELGADPRTWLPSQFVRLPDGTRHDSKGRQPVIYFDSEQL